MLFSYNKLWKLLIDKKMNKAELRLITGLSPNTMSRLSKGESVKMDIVGRICEQLECNIGDIVDYIPDARRICSESEGSKSTPQNKQAT